MSGRYAKFVPGWDMHGLPIEFATLKDLKLNFKDIDPIELRAKCRAHALRYSIIQRDSFLRMGVLGDYDASLPHDRQDSKRRSSRRWPISPRPSRLYKGLRSTLWCIKDETALADAEIEYKDRISPSIYVRFTRERRAARGIC